MRTNLISAAAIAAVMALPGFSTFATIIHGPVVHPVTGHRYYLLSNASWYDSQQEATGLHGNLVTINDAGENQWIIDTFSTVQGVTRQLWTGLNDTVLEGTFAWASGEPVTYANWQSGEPSGGPEDDDAVQIYPSPNANEGKWNDTARASTSLHGIVELPAASPPTVATGGVSITSPTTAILSGVFSRNGGETFAAFEIGPTTDFGISYGIVPNAGETQGTSHYSLGVSDLIPGTRYHYRAVAGNSAGSALGQARSFVAGNNPPSALNDIYTLPPGFGPFSLAVLDNDSDAEQDHFSILTVTQAAHGTVTITDNNTRVSYRLTDSNYLGEDSFTYTISDGFTETTATVTVQIPIRDPITSVVFAKNSPVPGAGVDPRVPAGAKFTSFGLPSINDGGCLAFSAQYRAPRSLRSVIVRSEANDVFSVVVQSGDAVPDEEGALFPFSFASFKDPLFINDGLIAFLARFSGPDINPGNDTGLFTESTSRQLRLVAREGDAAPGTDGATFSNFVSVAMGNVVQEGSDDTPRHVVAFVAQLNAAPDTVTAANDRGLWLYRSAFFADNSLQLVLREGSILDPDPSDALPGKTVRTFVALEPLPGSAGQGRGVAIREFTRVVLMSRVAFDDGTQAIVEFDAAGQMLKVKATGDPANSDLDFQTFSAPTQTAAGQGSYLATLTPEFDSPP
ncbi:MAG TPA: choice-of-anchor tandem repeat NxxGxxAF-containing protein, partial [Chthoniobacteraceae bacterium]|nr:choice-of-anchor tandem repeat NxxGxxAF-containing protein [Chthoniobacteraceae bacterium]